MCLGQAEQELTSSVHLLAVSDLVHPSVHLPDGVMEVLHSVGDRWSLRAFVKRGPSLSLGGSFTFIWNHSQPAQLLTNAGKIQYPAH